MPSYFRTTRDVELSTLYYLETNLNTDWSGTTTVKSFKQVYAKDINLPVVCVRLAETDSIYAEIGSTTLDNRYVIVIDIFCTSDGQRLDMADYIKDKLRVGWIHYEHSHPSGTNLTLDRTANGRDSVEEWLTDAKIEISETVDVKDQFRHNISIRVNNSI